MITLVTAFGILFWKASLGGGQTPKPQNIQLQGKTYPLTQPMELSGDGAVLDGHGATLTAKSGTAIHIGLGAHITLKNLKIVGFSTAISTTGATDLAISNVTVTNAQTGLHLEKIASGLVQGLQVHNCATAAELTACTKLVLEKSDLSQNAQTGLLLDACNTCVVRDNKIASNGDLGLKIQNGSSHNQILRNIVVRGKGTGISLAGGSPSTDNTLDGNDVSLNDVGLAVSGQAGNSLLDTSAGYCRIGIQLTNASNTLLKGNLAAGNTESGIEDDNGVKNSYDTNVFVQENGSPVALYLKSAPGHESNISVFRNIFQDYGRPIKVENVSPLTFQSNSFPGLKSTALEDIAQVVGKKPLAIDSQNEKPPVADIVTSTGAVAIVPTLYDRVGGISVSANTTGDQEIVVEGSLSGYFQGEEEVIGHYKGELPADIVFPPRFEAQVRVRTVEAKPRFFEFLALLGDNSMAKDLHTDDSGDTLFTPAFAVDGDRLSPDHYWKPPKGKAGEWWEVDLKHEQIVNAVSVMAPPNNPDAFWTKFHVAYSNTGLFKGEEQTVVTETDFPKHPGPIRVYRFPEVSARYIRIYGDIDQDGVQLQQFGVYGVRH